MKRLLTILMAGLLLCSPIYAITDACDGCVNPGQAQAVGGKGADGKFHEAATNNGGQLVVAPSGSPMPVSGTITTQPSGTPMPVTESGAWTVTTQPSGTPVPITATTPIPVTPKQLTGVPSTFTPVTSDGTVFTLAAGEIGFIQNLDDAAVYVKKGASASNSSFSFVLAACTVTDDAKGGAVRVDDWIGAVSIAAATGSPRVAAWKQAP